MTGADGHQETYAETWANMLAADPKHVVIHLTQADIDRLTLTGWTDTAND